MKYDKVKTRLVFPFHPVRDAKKAQKLKKEMASHGWKGRPLLVFEYGENYQALTGSHRLAAAEDVLEEVPAVIIENEDLTAAQWEDVLIIKDQDTLVMTLELLQSEGADIGEAVDLANEENAEQWD